ncbi:MAG TPA: DUF4918 family protein [Fulvivirga sp.]|nr:DUF4918 family protein [Fulvivirga sp.]
MTFGEKVIEYYAQLEAPKKLPAGVEVLHPFIEKPVMDIVKQYNDKYFNDINARTFLIGVNPGRLGSGTTGIPFTDPLRLKSELNIENDFAPKQELSSNFIYQMINALEGPEAFYKQFYFTSVCPLGFTKEGKNLNYYDLPALQKALDPYMVEQLKKQIAFGANPIAYSLGMGKNIAYLNKMNAKHKLFQRIEPLPHPRWIMQYRLKKLQEFIALYKSTLE